jgi:rhamnosyltransferase
MGNEVTIGIVIPTRNAGKLWKHVVVALKEQRNDFHRIVIIDSSSTDDTVQIAEEAGFDVISILPSNFNHGATRNFGAQRLTCDITVFLTQDVIPIQHAISNIAKVFEDISVAVAYGRQIPHDDANPIACHARMFSYKSYGYVYDFEDRKKHGLKTVFTSNSFAAYRTSLFLELGGFPHAIIFGEDMFFTAKALLSGHRVNYIAEAVVKHSHNYSLFETFRRSFDNGIFLRNESWIKKTFGEPDSEGIRFAVSEFLFLIRNKEYVWIFFAVLNNLSKIMGYKLGEFYHILPRRITKRISLCRAYWN